MQIRPDVHTYDIDWSYNGYDEPLSVHVIETDEASVQFGAGDQTIEDELVTIAREHDVEVVVVEHGHIDHYGGAERLQDSVDAAIAVPRGDGVVLRRVGIEPDVLLDGKSTYWEIETIPAPGHTRDNMAYLSEDVLVAGDTVVGSDSQFAAAGDWDGAFAPIEPRFNTSDAQARRSIATLLEYEFDLVLTSHGSNVLEDGRKEIETLVAELD